MEWVVLLVVVAVVVTFVRVLLITDLIATRGGLVWLVTNSIIGLILLFLTNLVVSPPIPINPLTILICALGGVFGWLTILILRLLQLGFYVPVVALFT